MTLGADEHRDRTPLTNVAILSPSLASTAGGLVFPAQLGEVVAMFWLAFGRLPPDSLLAAEH